MENREGRFFDKVKDILGSCCHKILAIDIKHDHYEVIKVMDSEWERKEQENGSRRISEWFNWFADSPFCYEAERARFKEFTNLEHLQHYFQENNYEKASLVYRRRNDLSEKVYRTVVLEIFPDYYQEGELTGFLFVRDLTSELHKQYKLVEEGLFHKGGIDKRTILLVEDNDLNREILADLLSDSYNILQANNGAVGLELLQMHMTSISLVVLDVEMPVMNGYEFLEYVRKDPFLSKIPIVVATGTGSLEEEWRCLQLGATDFVIKPYHAEIIKSRIAGIIKLKESKNIMEILQTDERTGLYTLPAFYYYGKLAIEQAEDSTYAVTIFDIENFKTINNIYGKQVGDQIIHTIAGALDAYPVVAKTHGRFSSARFYLLTYSMSVEETDTWIRSLFARLQKLCDRKSLRFKAGVYRAVARNLPISVVCQRTLLALNSVEPGDENRYAIYDKEHEEKERRLAIMEADRYEAFEKEQFCIYYQPKHDAHTGKLIGAEALIRWMHPELGLLMPGEFIPLFENNGFVSNVDYYVLMKTCQNLKQWIAAGLSPVPVSINFSRRDFEREAGIETLINTLMECGIDPSLIHIEVTETHFSERMDKMNQELRRCKDAGIQVELDDFGSGYSSLTMLASLPMDVMKLDMSFMRNYKDEKKRKVLSTCINLAHSLGMKTISEGVETAEQLELLRAYDCDWIQGYFFSKPLPEAEYKAYLINQAKKDE